MELHLKIIGWILIALALMHLAFPKYFEWDKELPALSLINSQMMVIHTFFVALFVLLNGMLCITSAHDLVATALGKKISLGLALFWGARLVVQFFGFSSELWKGKKMETAIHVFFAFLWVYLFGVFFMAFYR